MRRERIVVYACVAFVYVVTLIGAIAIPSVAAQFTAPTRLEIADLEPKVEAAREAIAPAEQAKTKVKIASLQLQLKALQSDIASACAEQPKESNVATQLLELSQRIDSNLAPGVAVSSYNLTVSGTPAPTATPSGSPSAAPQSGTDPSANATQDQTQDAQVGQQSATRAIVTGPSLDLTLHGPFPAIMSTLDTLTHREPAIAFAVSSVTRATDGVDAKFSVTVDHVPTGSCVAATAVSAHHVGRQKVRSHRTVAAKPAQSLQARGRR